MKIIVEMLAESAMLGKACHARMTLAIMTDAPEVMPSRISEEDIGAEVYGLSRSLEAPASTSKFRQIHCIIDRHKDISIFRYCLACHQRSHERNTQFSWTSLCSPDKRADGEKEHSAWFGDVGLWARLRRILLVTGGVAP